MNDYIHKKLNKKYYYEGLDVKILSMTKNLKRNFTETSNTKLLKSLKTRT